MDWASLLLAIVAVTLITMIPGGVLAAVLGLRGLRFAAVSVPAGASVVSIAALGAPFVGLPWGVAPVLITTIVLAGVVFLLRRLLWWGSTAVARADSPLRPGALLAMGGAVLVLLVQLTLVIGTPSNFSQTFDNIFHLNAVRFALDTENVSPLHLGQMTSAPTGGVPFYPSAWHAIAALVVQLTGVSIPIASNAVMMFFAAVAWPLSIALLVRSLWGTSTVRLVVALAVSVSIPAFPLLLVDYGVLFPYMMSLSMAAATLALLVDAFAQTQVRDRWPFIVGALGTLPALAISHPGGFVAVLVFASLILLVWWIGLLRSDVDRRTKRWAVIGAVIYLAVAGGSWYVLRPPAGARTWLTTETVGQAVGEVLTVSVWAGAVNVAVMLLATTGMFVALRRRNRGDWIALLIFIAAAGLYIVVSGLPYWTPRDILVGAWYNNAPRLAALLPFGWVPLAAVGGERIWSWGRTLVARSSRPTLLGAIAVVLAVLVVVVLPQATVMRTAVTSAQRMFIVDEHSPVVTADELALLNRLPEETDASGLVVGSPWTGTALAYALEGRDVMMPHTLMDITPEMQAILDGLNRATPGSAACDAVEDLNAEYVLDFGTQEVNGGEHPYRGLENLQTSDAVTLVDQEGDVKLYEIVGCER